MLVLLLAAIGYAGFMLSRLAPIATGHAAKALCSGVFVSGRPAASVIDVDIMAGVHPLLKLVRPSIDADRHRARATFAGFAEHEAEFRPGLGCTLALETATDVLPAALPPFPDPRPAPPAPAAAPAGVDAPALQAALDRAFDEPDPARPRRTRAVGYLARATPQSPRQEFGAHLWVKVPEPFNDTGPRARCRPMRFMRSGTKGSS